MRKQAMSNVVGIPSDNLRGGPVHYRLVHFAHVAFTQWRFLPGRLNRAKCAAFDGFNV